MEFNVDKSAIMNFGTLRNISKFDYKMKNRSLQVVKHHPYLGMELSDNMKYNLHIDSITSKASRVLGFVKRNLRHCPKVVKERAYQSLVRPKLEYSSTTWNPQQVTQKRQIEQVQRNAARFVSNKPFNYQNPTSNTSMTQQLNWPTLEARRRSWLCKSFWQSPPHKTTSQTWPLWSERKCQTMDRVLPQPQRTASDPWWSQVWICRSPLRGTTRDCPGTPVVPVLHQWLARVHKVFPSQAICRRQPSI